MPQGIVITVQPTKSLGALDPAKLTSIENINPELQAGDEQIDTPKDVFIGYCSDPTKPCTYESIDNVILYQGPPGQLKKGEKVEFEDIILKEAKIVTAQKAKPL